jgi:phosphate-selective porin OprO/OprP
MSRMGKLQTQALQQVARLALATVLLLCPVPTPGANPEVDPGADRSAEVSEAEISDPDREGADTEADHEEEALEHELLEQEVSKPEDRVVPAIDPEGWSYRWRNGSSLTRNDGRYEILFGGQIQYEGVAFHLDEGLERTDEDGWNSDSDFRRLRAYLQGFAFHHLMFKVAYDFEDEELKDLFVGLRGLEPLPVVKVGYMKAPFSLEQATSLQNSTFLERSLANALVPRRNTGVMATNTHFEQRLNWGAGVFFLDESLAETDASVEGLENDWEIAARVNWFPVAPEDGDRLLLVGCSYAHVFSDAAGLVIAQRPESRLVPALVGTLEGSAIDGADRFGVELAWLDGPLSIQAEALGLSVGRDRGASDLFFWGGYAQVSYFLTGERRIYGRTAGAFGRVIPKNPFRPSAGQWGAFQLAARVSTLDLNDRDVRGGQELNFTLGLNWYLLANLRFSANYVRGRVFGQGDVDILQGRLQVEF